MDYSQYKDKEKKVQANRQKKKSNSRNNNNNNNKSSSSGSESPEYQESDDETSEFSVTLDQQVKAKQNVIYVLLMTMMTHHLQAKKIMAIQMMMMKASMKMIQISIQTVIIQMIQYITKVMANMKYQMKIKYSQTRCGKYVVKKDTLM